MKIENGNGDDAVGPKTQEVHKKHSSLTNKIIQTLSQTI